VRHVTWFLGAVENFRFFDVKVYAFADPEAAVAEFKAEGLIKPTGAYLCPGLCAVPACCRGKDRVPTRIFQSCECSQGAGYADSWSQILKTSGDGPEVWLARSQGQDAGRIPPPGTPAYPPEADPLPEGDNVGFDPSGDFMPPGSC
jgi:hypothetical protein